MAKIYGLFGSMTGKLADVVMAVRNGEQVARKYQPIVSNPSTTAQVAQRAKLKLLSQLSAVMAPVIAIARKGNVSARNLFTKVNFGETSYNNNAASITLANIQLTDSNVAMPSIGSERGDNAITAYINNPIQAASLDVDRVVYCIFEVTDDEKLRYAGSAVSTELGNNNWGVDELPAVPGRYLVLAYGVRDNTENARTVFGNLDVPSANTVANLITTRTLTEVDVTMSETRGFLSPAPTRDGETDTKKSTEK